MTMPRGPVRGGYGPPPGCRDIRQLLGVYVLGAIDPAERPAVDDHLAWCQSCRDELAGLAPLPAMLGRVPAADVERIAAEPAALPPGLTAPRQLLDSLLARVAARRARRLRRAVISVAAGAAVLAGGAAAAVALAAPAAQPVAAARAQSVRATSPATGVGALVDYAKSPWGGTTMRVQVSGVAAGTTCDFWVVGPGGRSWAGEWKVLGYGDKAWYPVAAAAAPGAVRSFQLTTTGGKVLVNIPADSPGGH